MDPDSDAPPPRPYASYAPPPQLWTPAMELSPPQSDAGCSSADADDAEEKEPEPKPRGLNLLLAPRAYSSSDDGDGDVDMDGDEHSVDSSEARDEDEPKNVSIVKPRRRADSMDDLPLSLESLSLLANQRGLDAAGLSRWSVREDGKLQDETQHKFRTLRDALRAYTHLLQGVVPREDMYYLAILRRKLAEQELPLVDGPITVVELGSVVPEEHFYTSKKLFPVGGDVWGRKGAEC
jgi:hypothetical protein